MNCSMPDSFILHYLLEFAQIQPFVKIVKSTNTHFHKIEVLVDVKGNLKIKKSVQSLYLKVTSGSK